MPEIVLGGCRTTPMAGYLKALGVFRLVAEQADRGGKGYWNNSVFTIRTTLDQTELLNFFVEEYNPTPIVSPWNGGSGFYEGDAREGLEAIMSSSQDRFAEYRNVIEQIRSWQEMPKSYQLISDVAETLQAMINNMRPGKKRDETESLLSDIESNLARCGSSPALTINRGVSISVLEDQSKKDKTAAGSDLKSLWNAVKKGRTACVKMERGGNKAELFSICRSRLPESFLSWLDACVAIKSDGSPGYNWVLGAGGIEGRLELSNNFMQRLAQLLILGNPDECRMALQSALFGDPTPGLVKASVGQFDPGRAGGYNQGHEIETKNFKINPWDYVLMMEGAATLSGSVVRHKLADPKGQAAIPFLTGFSGVGFNSSDLNEDGRAEAWLPTWPDPTGYAEVRYLFGEGRSSIGRHHVKTGLDFARAVSVLGVDRGLDSFVRFALLKRRGDSFVALPAGTLPVQYRPEVRLLDDLDPIINKVDAFYRGFKNVPATYESARHKLLEAVYACCERPDTLRFTTIVRSLGRLENLLTQRDRSKKPALTKPLQGLRTAWISRCDDGGVEVRLAAALASIKTMGAVGPVRANIGGVDPRQPWKWAKDKSQKSWHGLNLVEKLGSVLVQRIMDAERTGTERPPLTSNICLHPRDVVPFLYGDTDDQKIEDLLWGFLLVDWRGDLHDVRSRWSRQVAPLALPRAWSLLKTLHNPGQVRGQSLRIEPRLPTLLRAGRIREACGIAVNRLRAANLKPLLVQYEEALDPKRMLAGLLVPTHHDVLESLVLSKPEPNNKP